MSGHDPAALVRPQEPALARLDDQARRRVGTCRVADAALSGTPPRPHRLRVVRDRDGGPADGGRTSGG